jgi:hypothetical protein
MRMRSGLLRFCAYVTSPAAQIGTNKPLNRSGAVRAILHSLTHAQTQEI